MKNRRGFTLVEMIFVIVVLCLVATASVSIFINIRKSILEKEYNNVVSYLETKAIEYANKTNITTNIINPKTYLLLLKYLFNFIKIFSIC